MIALQAQQYKKTAQYNEILSIIESVAGDGGVSITYNSPLSVITENLLLKDGFNINYPPMTGGLINISW